MAGLSLKAAAYIMAGLRLTFPLVIFQKPVLGTLFAFLLDGIDFELLRFFGMKRLEYQLFDKYLDFYWYVLIGIYLLGKNLPDWQSNFFAFLFIVRLIGEVSLIATRKERILIFFPNFFELFFWFWLFIPGLVSSPSKAWLTLLVCFVPKVAHEYLVHNTTFSTFGFVKKIVGKLS